MPKAGPPVTDIRKQNKTKFKSELIYYNPINERSFYQWERNLKESLENVGVSGKISQTGVILSRFTQAKVVLKQKSGNIQSSKTVGAGNRSRNRQ